MMIFAVIALGVAFWAMIELGRQSRGDRDGWRRTAMTLGGLCVVGAALAGSRGSWPVGLVLMLAGTGLISAALGLPRSASRTSAGGSMDLAEARTVLGVEPEASKAEINAAWRRLMARAHPDQGGTEGMAAQLNAARDVLLKRR